MVTGNRTSTPTAEYVIMLVRCIDAALIEWALLLARSLPWRWV